MKLIDTNLQMCYNELVVGRFFIINRTFLRCLIKYKERYKWEYYLIKSIMKYTLENEEDSHIFEDVKIRLEKKIERLNKHYDLTGESYFKNKL